MSHDITIRSRPTAVRHVWTAGCLYAGVLVIAGVLTWVFGAQPVPSPLLVYGIVVGFVLVFSRGLYNRSIVSGLMLLGSAFGPTVRGVGYWFTGAGVEFATVQLVVAGVVAVAGLAFGVQVIRALLALWKGET